MKNEVNKQRQLLQCLEQGSNRGYPITIQERIKDICLDAARAQDDILSIPLESTTFQDPFPSEESDQLLRDKEQLGK